MSDRPQSGELSRAELFRVLEPYRSSHNLRGGILFGVDWFLFAVTVYFAATGPALWFRILSGLIAGLLITRLWVIGHDACHQSLFSGRRANRVVGRLCFLPSLIPYSLWEVGHNIAHHGYNNLRNRDYVWTPLSADEYLSLPPWRQLLERLYRSGIGFGPYFMIEMWWKRLYVPSSPLSGVRRLKFFTFDFVLVTIFAAIWLSAVIFGADAAGVNRLDAIINAVILPFCVWTVLIGLVIHVHHIHPDVPWYAEKSDWLEAQAVCTSTVHVDWPVLNSLLHNILVHPAHHIDSKISLFELPAAERALEQEFPAYFKKRPLRWADHVRSIRACKLFDYQSRSWIPFPK